MDGGDWRGQIALVDEGSMVSTDLAMDLIDTGAKVIVSRGQGQLPPVNGVRILLQAGRGIARGPPASLGQRHHPAGAQDLPDRCL